MFNTNKYGRKIRKLVNDATENKARRYECPKCGKIKVKRCGFSIWVCASCGAKIAGGAYTLTTDSGAIANNIIGSNKID